MGRSRLVPVVLASALSVVETSGARPPGRAEVVETPAPATMPGASLPVVGVHWYRMAGRIRPLVFWIGRDEVGLARLVLRRGDAGERGYELLVGTDPELAPRAINRWGYIVEETGSRGGSLLALMSPSDEVSFGEAQANVERGGHGSVEFKAVRGRVDSGVATWQPARVRTAGGPTIREVEPLLDRVRRETAAAASRSVRVPSGTRPGFLAAVAELVDLSLPTNSRRLRPNEIEDLPVPYAFGQGLYELRIRSLRPTSVAQQEGRPAVRALEAAFEIRTIATGVRTRFDMVLGTDGQLAGVPLTIAWQPRWWLKVELHLDDANRRLL